MILADLALFLTFASLLTGVLAGFHPPGTLISLSPTFKPRLGNLTLLKQGVETNTIAGLLSARQETCTPGYALCPNIPDSCCPAGGDCCTDPEGCCPIGAQCCSGGGCCSDTDTCVVVNGQPGCCQIGENCSGNPTGCDLPGYDPCPNSVFCCPTGDTCFTDNNGQPACSGPDNPTSFNPGSSTPPPSSTSRPSTTVLPPSLTTSSPPTITFQPTTDSPGLSTTQSADEQTFTQSFPSSGSGGTNAVNSTVAATDPRITYDGSSWATSNACGSTSKRASTTGDSLIFQFQGTAIFLNSVVGLNAGLFSVDIDGKLADVDGFSTSASGCQINWSAFGLTNTLHTITITFKGASSNPNAGSSTASFEYTNFIVTSTGSSSSNGTPEPSNAISASMKLGNKWETSFWSGVAFAGILAW